MSTLTLATTFTACGFAALYAYFRRARTLLDKLPPTTKRVRLLEGAAILADAKFELSEVPLKPPGFGEVVIKVEASAVNPSDYGGCRAGNASKNLGNECSGTVVATGGGLSTAGLLGAPCFAHVSGIGGYAEYATVPARTVTRLPTNIPVEDGCAFFINPFTVYAMLQQVKTHKQKYVVHTAAASVLGQMLVKASKKFEIEVINVVRREEQAECLRALGATHVLVSSSESFWQDLHGLIERYKIKIAFDALGGEYTGALMKCLPPDSTVYVYGRLQSSTVDALPTVEMIYHNKRVEGFLVMRALASHGIRGTPFGLYRASWFVKRHFAELFLPPKFEDVPLEGVADLFGRIDPHGANPVAVTGCKYRVRPWM